MRIGVVSDLHWPADPHVQASWHNPFDFASLPERVDSARRLFADHGVAAMVVVGDLCHAGDRASAQAAIGRLVAVDGPPVLIVAGNHDCLQRDDLLSELIEPPAACLDGTTRELDGWRFSGVGITCDGDERSFRWDGRWPDDDECGDVVISHFPVVSRAPRVGELGLEYPFDLLDLPALESRIRAGAEPTIVLSGHIHVREAHVSDTLLQLSAGALVESPFEVSIVDLERDEDHVRVRRRATRLGPPAQTRDPVLAPDDETWIFHAGSWRSR